MIDITAIPAERLALLDTAALFHGSHPASIRTSDCQHCARELLHEVVTGHHLDANLDDGSAWIGILPTLNDGSWRDDAHRTTVIRPYLRRLLELDPRQDQARLWPFVDYFYRSLVPELLERLKYPDEAAKLRASEGVIDQKSARDVACGLCHTLNRAVAFDLNNPVDLALDLARDLRRIFAFDLYSDFALAIDNTVYFAHVLTLGLDHSTRADQWEKITREILDRICGPITSVPTRIEGHTDD
jgi:hypothetical protein